MLGAAPSARGKLHSFQRSLWAFVKPFRFQARSFPMEPNLWSPLRRHFRTPPPLLVFLGVLPSLWGVWWKPLVFFFLKSFCWGACHTKRGWPYSLLFFFLVKSVRVSTWVARFLGFPFFGSLPPTLSCEVLLKFSNKFRQETLYFSSFGPISLLRTLALAYRISPLKRLFPPCWNYLYSSFWWGGVYSVFSEEGLPFWRSRRYGRDWSLSCPFPTRAVPINSTQPQVLFLSLSRMGCPGHSSFRCLGDFCNTTLIWYLLSS